MIWSCQRIHTTILWFFCLIQGNGSGILWARGSQREPTKWGNHVLQYRAVTHGFTRIRTGQVKKKTDSWFVCAIVLSIKWVCVYMWGAHITYCWITSEKIKTAHEILFLKTVRVVGEAKPTAGEMLKELQVHWSGVLMCGVRRKGKPQRVKSQKAFLCGWWWPCNISMTRYGKFGWMYTCWIMMATWWMPPASPRSPPCATSDDLMLASKEMKSLWWVSNSHGSL